MIEMCHFDGTIFQIDPEHTSENLKSNGYLK